MAHLPITLTNSQSTTMASGSAYLLSGFNASTYAAYEASNLRNISFQTGAGAFIYSWKETHGATNASTAVNYWLKLPAAIPVQGDILEQPRGEFRKPRC